MYFIKIILVCLLFISSSTRLSAKNDIGSKDYVLALNKATNIMVNDVTSPVAAEKNHEKARLAIRDRLTQLAPIFIKNKYMLGDDFSMLDVAIAPLLWRLEHYGIDLSRNAAPLMKYAERIFSRPAYIEALTPSEKVMRR
jgi:glutathione S-transferase